MESTLSWYIIPIALVLDFALGDPVRLPHPIRWMGRVIEILEPRFRNLPVRLSVSGVLFSLFLIGTTWVLAFILVSMAHALHPIAGRTVEVLMMYYCISITCLEKYAMEVYHSLIHTGMEEAKTKVSRIVGRDVNHLDEKGVSQAAVESVAENLVDGVITPLFFAIIGGAPFALAFKMVNTLDSMVGYKNDRYRRFGKASARIDDVANFIPARLSVPIISMAAFLLSKNGRRTFTTAVNEGHRHASPNAGYPEAAFAGALGVRLGGTHLYGGQKIVKPHIGTRFGSVTTAHIKQACDLMLLSSILWGAIASGIILLRTIGFHGGM